LQLLGILLLDLFEPVGMIEGKKQVVRAKKHVVSEELS
jgi:hypothetical protein